MPQHRSIKGQALVEFALTATLIFFLLAATVDLGLIFFTLQGLHNAAQEGGNYGSRFLNAAGDVDYAEIRNRARHEAGTRSTGFANLLDLNNNGTDDDLEDHFHIGDSSGTSVFPTYIDIKALEDVDGDGNPLDDNNLTFCTNVKDADKLCYLQVTVSSDYNFLFPLAPAFANQRRLSSSYVIPIRAGFAQGGAPTSSPVVWTLTPTQTPSQAPTTTRTVTSGPAATSTRTATAGPSLTPTRTWTPGPTSTATRTPTITQTPTRTNTPTNTPTSTNTPTATRTPTGATPTPTRTPTSTPTSTPTNTPTATNTPSPTPCSVLSAPSLTASRSSSTVSLGWGAVAGAVSYKVYRSSDGGSSFGVIASPTGTSATDTIPRGTTYLYYVKAVNACGSQGAQSNVVSVTRP